MKQGALLQIYLLSIILLHCFCGCENQSYPQTLISADSLSSVNPDSAIAILTAMKERIAAENKQTQMYYQLICLKAKDKAYITHTSDNSILQILKYYEQKEEKKASSRGLLLCRACLQRFRRYTASIGLLSKSLGCFTKQQGL